MNKSKNYVKIGWNKIKNQYWLDAYDEQNNVVLEIYERYHYRNGTLRPRDARRETEIKKLLKCKFYTITI